MKAKGQGLIYPRGAIWWCQYYVRGKRYRETSESTNRAEAVRLLKKRIAEAAAGKPFGSAPADHTRRPEKDAARRLRGQRPACPGHQGAARAPGRLLRSGLPGCRYHERSPDRIHRRPPERERQELNYQQGSRRPQARLCPRGAGLQGWLTPVFPYAARRQPPQGFFEHEDYLALLDHLPEELKPAIQTAYITGWRITSEILTRQKHHVDLEAGWLRLDPGESKNGEGRMFPLTPELRAVLEAQLERTRALEVEEGPDHPVALSAQRPPDPHVPPLLADRLQGGEAARANPTRFSSHRCAQPRARRRPALSGNGDGRPQDRGHLSAVCDRRRNDATRRRREARRAASDRYRSQAAQGGRAEGMTQGARTFKSRPLEPSHFRHNRPQSGR